MAADQAFLLASGCADYTAESSMLSGAAPLISGSVRIPTGRRIQVENLLSVVLDGRV